jgi:hypothetical protein
MVKIFRGDCHTVESDINSWMEVYHPRVVDAKHSVTYLDKEHSVLLIVIVFYEAKSETEKVEYRMFGHAGHQR